MTSPAFRVLQHAELASLICDRTVLRAEELPPLLSAVNLLSACEALRQDTVTACEALRQDTLTACEDERRRARNAGYADGSAAGWRAATDEIDASLQAVHAQLHAERVRHDDEVGAVAIAIVRHIAESLAAEQVVAALIGSALERRRRHADADTAFGVRVHPVVASSLRDRLLAASSTALTIVADENVAPLDVLIQTRYSRIDAGLNAQLDAIAARFSGEVAPADAIPAAETLAPQVYARR